jgi:hypothetical protein
MSNKMKVDKEKKSCFNSLCHPDICLARLKRITKYPVSQFSRVNSLPQQYALFFISQLSKM